MTARQRGVQLIGHQRGRGPTHAWLETPREVRYGSIFTTAAWCHLRSFMGRGSLTTRSYNPIIPSRRCETRKPVRRWHGRATVIGPHEAVSQTPSRDRVKC